MKALNVLGTELVTCSLDPLTGFFRDGCCNTDENDQGAHLICTRMTDEFLRFSLEQGNDLVTPRPEFGFPGLQPGDQWCLCALRWREAYHAARAPRVVLQSTHAEALEFVTLEQLREYAWVN